MDNEIQLTPVSEIKKKMGMSGSLEDNRGPLVYELTTCPSLNGILPDGNTPCSMDTED